MRLGVTDFALPAAIFCSLTNGVQKLEIFNYTTKFGLVMLTIFAAVKHFAMKLKLETFMKQLNRFTKLQFRALQLQPVLRTIMMWSHRIPVSYVHLVQCKQYRKIRLFNDINWCIGKRE